MMNRNSMKTHQFKIEIQSTESASDVQHRLLKGLNHAQLAVNFVRWTPSSGVNDAENIELLPGRMNVLLFRSTTEEERSGDDASHREDVWCEAGWRNANGKLCSEPQPITATAAEGFIKVSGLPSSRFHFTVCWD
jgi:hypothetical protein